MHNGINLDEYEYCEHKEDYLLFLGRIDREKGVHEAVDVAERTGMRTVIAGPAWDGELFREIRSRIKKNPNITYVGEVHGKAKQKLLKHAKWLIFPTACEEQFGLVLVEAMACGTPVLAYSRGAIPEVLAGFPELLCRDMEEMATKAAGKPPVSPWQLRRYIAERFTSERMAERYLNIYEQVFRWRYNTRIRTRR